MKANWQSFALIWAFSLQAHAAPVPAQVPQFNAAVTARLTARGTRPEVDRVQRYFLCGTGALTELEAPVLKTLGQYEALKVGVYNVQDRLTQDGARWRMQDIIAQDERAQLFTELDLRSDWEREQLRGKVRRRIDFDLGGAIERSEVSYDESGRRSVEKLFDPARHVLFSRRYVYGGSGAVPLLIAALDSNGVTTTAIRFTLDARGLPLEEDHTDSEGLPILHRAYRYDKYGFLSSFKETQGAALRGLRIEFVHDKAGRLLERRLRNRDVLEVTVGTIYKWDGAEGALSAREEYVTNLRLGDLRRVGSGWDPRMTLKYRWVFERDEARLFLLPLNGQGNELFPWRTRRLTLHKGGWLEQDDTMGPDHMSLSREFWSWNEHDDLSRHEIWGSPGATVSGQSVDFSYDLHGNWTSRRAFGEPEQERKFEYYGE